MSSQVRVTASDADDDGCDLRRALKSRLGARVEARNWRLRKGPFGLDPFVRALEFVHKELRRGLQLEAALAAATGALGDVHGGLRRFVECALAQYFDYHESREQELGPLNFLGVWTVVPLKQNARLGAWGPLYESAAGDREIRRLRMGKARDELTPWASIAAKVAGQAVGAVEPRRIHVVELGLADGIEEPLLTGLTPEQVETRYDDTGRDAANDVVLGSQATPGVGCGDCQAAAVCPELVPVPEVLQQDHAGRWTRSIAMHELLSYEQCPAQWYLRSVAKLPGVDDGTPAIHRGNVVHEWLKLAHQRETPCTAADLPEPDTGHLGLAEGVLSQDDCAIALPFLKAHIPVCPLADAGTTVVEIERNVHGFDAISDVVAVAKPDMVLRRGDALVFHEVKTTEARLPESDDDAREKYPVVAMNLLMLEHGVTQWFGAAHGEVQLEVVTPRGARVFRYGTDDELVMTLSRSRIRNLTGEWLDDREWETRPGAHCRRCSVRRWCPDSVAADAPVDGDSC
ncbi:PD-(D/E)XK nuclease family protein [Saccharopolyspora sp. K220]|uniref:PD-(D/E)XK nuclease family protein n=1 Tax=Saccharopolyspora soli TaxID=2926618 RepID=UPI001F56B7C8|nr:PD-(D/E)XK nuclease family protein [Saccharopolyspora soli]MCI2418325.1 PD-(D/E)XK nuclease family protein [Saccharopolyspora soli]